MVKAVELDIKLQKIANGNHTASSPHVCDDYPAPLGWTDLEGKIGG